MIPKDSDLTTIPQILKTDILLLNHPQAITTSLMNPNIRVTSLIIVIEQALHTSLAILSRHISFVYALAFQSLWGAWFQSVNLLQYGPNSYLKLHRLVSQVPNPCAKSWGLLSVISASIKTAPNWENAQSGHFWFDGLQVFGDLRLQENMHLFCAAEVSLISLHWYISQKVKSYFLRNYWLACYKEYIVSPSIKELVGS